MVVAGETLTLFPVPNNTPPQEPLNHCVVAPVPAVPPANVKVVESPLQIDVVPVMLVGATDGVLTVNTVGSLVAVPDAVVTVTKPVVPAPIIAVICVLVNEEIEATEVPPIFTLVAVMPVKLVPLITIEFPVQPLVEPSPVMVGKEAVTSMQ